MSIDQPTIPERFRSVACAVVMAAAVLGCGSSGGGGAGGGGNPGGGDSDGSGDGGIDLTGLPSPLDVRDVDGHYGLRHSHWSLDYVESMRCSGAGDPNGDGRADVLRGHDEGLTAPFPTVLVTGRKDFRSGTLMFEPSDAMKALGRGISGEIGRAHV